jgi:predicted dinucleotide-binding enzyme
VKIGIIGAGHIGGTLGELFAARGHDVLYGVREGSDAPGKKGSVAEAAAHGEVVILAVPWRACEEAVAVAGDLAGKVLIDATNMGGDQEQSGAEKIAGWAPGARVVKSFNQAGWETLKEPLLDGHRAVMLAAGDDEAARRTTIELGEELGLEMVDAGPLENARLLESLASLWIYLAFRGGQGRDFAFSLLRRGGQ